MKRMKILVNNNNKTHSISLNQKLANSKYNIIFFIDLETIPLPIHGYITFNVISRFSETPSVSCFFLIFCIGYEHIYIVEKSQDSKQMIVISKEITKKIQSEKMSGNNRMMKINKSSILCYSLSL